MLIFFSGHNRRKTIKNLLKILSPSIDIFVLIFLAISINLKHKLIIYDSTKKNTENLHSLFAHFQN